MNVFRELFLTMRSGAIIRLPTPSHTLILEDSDSCLLSVERTAIDILLETNGHNGIVGATA